MNRFDPQFNGLDPETNRPFSHGHPDGVWMIAIVYGFFVVFSLVGLVMGIIGLAKTGLSGAATPLISLIALGLFTSVIYFAFARSAKTIYPAVVLLMLLIIALAVVYFVAPASLIAVALATFIQGYIAHYIYGLEKDKLLFN